MTDVTINESKQKTPDVNARSSQTPEDSRRATQSKNEHYGMATVTITPGTPDFNRFLTARNRSVIRGFNDVSIAISSLFRTVNAVKHPELVQAIQDWFNELHDENNLMKQNLEAHIATIKVDESDPFFSSTEFSLKWLKWFTEFGHLNRGDMLTSEQHRCHNEKKKFQRRV